MKKIIYLITLLMFIGCDNVEIINTSEADTTESSQTPIANAGTDKTILLGEEIEISGSGTDSDGNIVDYEWREGTVLVSGLKDFTYLGTVEGIHTLTLTVVDDDGFTDSDTMDIEVTTESDAVI